MPAGSSPACFSSPCWRSGSSSAPNSSAIRRPGPVAGSAADTLSSWAPWAGVAIFGAGIFVHNCAPRRSLGWLLVVLFAAYIGQLAGKQILDATLSGFVGAIVMVPIAHLVARAPSAPPAHVTILPAFWLLVPGAIGLIGITEIVGENHEAGVENFLTALVSIPSIALGSSSGRCSCG